MTSTELVTTHAADLDTYRPDLSTLAGAWLASLTSERTRAAYRVDLVRFSEWCAQLRVEVLPGSRQALDAYRVAMLDAGLSASTCARRLSALASFYAYLVDEGLLVSNPAANVKRPRVSQESPTLGLDRDEAQRFLSAAADAGPRDEALACLLLLNGLRASEVAGLNLDDLDTYNGHRFAKVTGKGEKVRRAALAPRTIDAIERAAAGRTAGPVFLDADGQPLSRHAVPRVVARLARAAGITKRISPHSCRHAFVTLALDAGATLRDVQDAAGHASPETTRRYDRARGLLDRSPTYALASLLAG